MGSQRPCLPHKPEVCRGPDTRRLPLCAVPLPGGGSAREAVLRPARQLAEVEVQRTRQLELRLSISLAGNAAARQDGQGGAAWWAGWHGLKQLGSKPELLQAGTALRGQAGGLDGALPDYLLKQQPQLRLLGPEEAAAAATASVGGAPSSVTVHTSLDEGGQPAKYYYSYRNIRLLRSALQFFGSPGGSAAGWVACMQQTGC